MASAMPAGGSALATIQRLGKVLGLLRGVEDQLPAAHVRHRLVRTREISRQKTELRTVPHPVFRRLLPGLPSADIQEFDGTTDSMRHRPVPYGQPDPVVDIHEPHHGTHLHSQQMEDTPHTGHRHRQDQTDSNHWRHATEGRRRTPPLIDLRDLRDLPEEDPHPPAGKCGTGPRQAVEVRQPRLPRLRRRGHARASGRRRV
jgi:hypothetical protein